MNHYRNLSAAILVATGGIAQATMIDNFLPIDHSQDLTFGEKTYVNRSFVAVQTGDMLGGERDVEFFQAERTFFEPPQFIARYEPNPNESNRVHFRFGMVGPGGGNGQAIGHARLQYDGRGDENGNTGLDRTLNNVGSGVPLFNAQDGGIRLWTTATGLFRVIDIEVVLRRQGQELGRVARSITESTNFVPTNFEFSPDIFGIADSFSVEMNPPNFAPGFANQSLFISHIDTVLPEPGTYAAFAAGLGLLGLRARRKRAA